MRIKALILFFPFAIFLAETASFIPAMKAACAIVAPKKSSCAITAPEKVSCTKTEKPEKSSCCKPKKQEQCPAKKDTGKKPADNKCTDTPDCSSCPVCYTFIFQPQYEWPAQQFSFKKNYSLLTAHYISSFTQDVWRPPNGPILY